MYELGVIVNCPLPTEITVEVGFAATAVDDGMDPFVLYLGNLLVAVELKLFCGGGGGGGVNMVDETLTFSSALNSDVGDMLACNL